MGRDYVFILSADKGRATVVMGKCDYDKKMTEMLRYKPLERDLTPVLERKLNSFLLQLKRNSPFILSFVTDCVPPED